MHSISREWRGLEMSWRRERESCWLSGLILNEFQPFLRPCLLSHARAAIFISPHSKIRSNKSVEFHSLHKEKEICRRSECVLLGGVCCYYT